MSKRFKSQDYFRYPKLGKRWRKPKGLQSKLRLEKGGSGMKAAIGYGSPHTPQPLLVTSMKDLEKDCSNGIIFSSRLGSKKTAVLAAKTKELGIKVVNMKKARRATRLAAALKKKKEVTKQKKEQEKKEEKVKSEAKGEKKMGFDDDVVPQIAGGKTKTYRLRDHGLKAGDMVAFENTQKKEVFGHAKITKVEKVVVEKFDLRDPEHYVVYNSTEELMEALKKRNPDREVTPKTEMFAYTYEFTPMKHEKEAKK
ncbi:MAG: hypothetical protein J4400_00535 [Candidatus Aenigmarchaeota archaeon]|nr:hypothetical protein [Candidatus Aenigmarchaeota archaeon]